ncbi:MAG: phage baseplate assembly protein V [Cellulomonas sp.]
MTPGTEPRRYFGKYRGKVENNLDPMMLGRVQVSVPSVLGESTIAWAMPCVPYAGDGVGIFALPPTGTQVWVEFEAGDLDKAILAGCFWGTGEVPASPAIEQVKVWKTDSISVELSDVPGAGGLTITVDSPAVPVPITFSCTASGIELSIGASKVLLSATSVSINDGALEVI